MKSSTKAGKSSVGFTKTEVQPIHHKPEAKTTPAEAKPTALHAAKTEQNVTPSKLRMTKSELEMATLKPKIGYRCRPLKTRH